MKTKINAIFVKNYSFKNTNIFSFLHFLFFTIWEPLLHYGLWLQQIFHSFTALIPSGVQGFFITLNLCQHLLSFIYGGVSFFVISINAVLLPYYSQLDLFFAFFPPRFRQGVQEWLSNFQPLEFLFLATAVIGGLIALPVALFSEERNFLLTAKLKKLHLHMQQEVYSELYLFMKVKGKIQKQRAKEHFARACENFPLTLPDIPYPPRGYIPLVLTPDPKGVGGSWCSATNPQGVRVDGSSPLARNPDPVPAWVGDTPRGGAHPTLSGYQGVAVARVDEGRAPVNPELVPPSLEQGGHPKGYPPPYPIAVATVLPTLASASAAPCYPLGGSGLEGDTRPWPLPSAQAEPPLGVRTGRETEGITELEQFLLDLWLREGQKERKEIDGNLCSAQEIFHEIKDFEQKRIKAWCTGRWQLPSPGEVEKALNRIIKENRAKLSQPQDNFLLQKGVRKTVPIGQEVEDWFDEERSLRKSAEEYEFKLRRSLKNCYEFQLETLDIHRQNQQIAGQCRGQLHRDHEVEKTKAADSLRIAIDVWKKADRARRKFVLQEYIMERSREEWLKNAESMLHNRAIREQVRLRTHYEKGLKADLEKESSTYLSLLAEQRKVLEKERDDLVQLYINRIVKIKKERDGALYRLRCMEDRADALYRLHSSLSEDIYQPYLTTGAEWEEGAAPLSSLYTDSQSFPHFSVSSSGCSPSKPPKGVRVEAESSFSTSWEEEIIGQRIQPPIPWTGTPPRGYLLGPHGLVPVSPVESLSPSKEWCQEGSASAAPNPSGSEADYTPLSPSYDQYPQEEYWQYPVPEGISHAAAQELASSPPSYRVRSSPWIPPEGVPTLPLQGCPPYPLLKLRERLPTQQRAAYGNPDPLLKGRAGTPEGGMEGYGYQGAAYAAALAAQDLSPQQRRYSQDPPPHEMGHLTPHEDGYSGYSASQEGEYPPLEQGSDYQDLPPEQWEYSQNPTPEGSRLLKLSRNFTAAGVREPGVNPPYPGSGYANLQLVRSSPPYPELANPEELARSDSFSHYGNGNHLRFDSNPVYSQNFNPDRERVGGVPSLSVSSENPPPSPLFFSHSAGQVRAVLTATEAGEGAGEQGSRVSPPSDNSQSPSRTFTGESSFSTSWEEEIIGYPPAPCVGTPPLTREGYGYQGDAYAAPLAAGKGRQRVNESTGEACVPIPPEGVQCPFTPEEVYTLPGSREEEMTQRESGHSLPVRGGEKVTAASARAVEIPNQPSHEEENHLFGENIAHLRGDMYTLLGLTPHEIYYLTPQELLDYAYMRFMFLNRKGYSDYLETPPTHSRLVKAQLLVEKVVEREMSGGIGKVSDLKAMAQKLLQEKRLKKGVDGHSSFCQPMQSPELAPLDPLWGHQGVTAIAAPNPEGGQGVSVSQNIKGIASQKGGHPKGYPSPCCNPDPVPLDAPRGGQGSGYQGVTAKVPISSVKPPERVATLPPAKAEGILRDRPEEGAHPTPVHRVPTGNPDPKGYHPCDSSPLDPLNPDPLWGYQGVQGSGEGLTKLNPPQGYGGKEPLLRIGRGKILTPPYGAPLDTSRVGAQESEPFQPKGKGKHSMTQDSPLRWEKEGKWTHLAKEKMSLPLKSSEAPPKEEKREAAENRMGEQVEHPFPPGSPSKRVYATIMGEYIPSNPKMETAKRFDLSIPYPFRRTIPAERPDPTRGYPPVPISSSFAGPRWSYPHYLAHLEGGNMQKGTEFLPIPPNGLVDKPFPGYLGFRGTKDDPRIARMAKEKPPMGIAQLTDETPGEKGAGDGGVPALSRWPHQKPPILPVQWETEGGVSRVVASDPQPTQRVRGALPPEGVPPSALSVNPDPRRGSLPPYPSAEAAALTADQVKQGINESIGGGGSHVPPEGVQFYVREASNPDPEGYTGAAEAAAYAAPRYPLRGSGLPLAASPYPQRGCPPYPLRMEPPAFPDILMIARHEWASELKRRRGETEILPAEAEKEISVARLDEGVARSTGIKRERGSGPYWIRDRSKNKGGYFVDQLPTDPIEHMGFFDSDAPCERFSDDGGSHFKWKDSSSSEENFIGWF